MTDWDEVAKSFFVFMGLTAAMIIVLFVPRMFFVISIIVAGTLIVHGVRWAWDTLWVRGK